MFKKLGTLVLGIAVVLTLAACSDTSLESNASEYIVGVDINPSIEFIVDEEEFVTSYNLVNDDALVLCADVEFIGMNIEDAIELFIQLATDAGFIDVEAEDNAVLFTVLGGDNDELKEKLQQKIRVRAVSFFARNFINAEIFTEDFTHQELIDQANELGINAGKLKLILLAQTYDETLTIELATEMAVKDLVLIVREAQFEAMGKLTDEEKLELKEQKLTLMNQFQNKLQTHLENKTDLTDEEIEVIANRTRNTLRTTTKEEWQEAANTWRNNLSQRQNDNESEEATE